MSKILFIATMEGFPWGGSEELWARSAAMLAAKHEVACSVHAWPELHPQLQALQQRGVTVMPRRSNQSRATRLCNWFLPDRWHRKAASPIEETITWFKPDLVVVNQDGNTDGWAAMLACQQHSVPYVNVIQAVPEGVFWPDDFEINRQRPLYQSSRRLYFISKRNHEFLETQFATRFSNGMVIHNPFNVPHDLAMSWPEPDIPLRLACIARIEFYAKGQDLLVDVFSQSKWRERAVTVDFFGSGPNQKILEDQIRRLNLTNLVVRGFVQDVTSIWASHHALVLASRQEGLPLALVEAFLCSRPAVVTRIGGNAELVVDDSSGFVAAAPTAELMDETLERLWQKRTELAAMGAEARRTVELKVPSKPVELFVKDLTRHLKRQA